MNTPRAMMIPTVSLSLLMAAAAWAQSPQGPPLDGGIRRPAPSPLMQALDINGDGELSAQEIERATTSLKKLDADNNGRLTAAELEPAPVRPAGPSLQAHGPPDATPAERFGRFIALDKNRDGKLDKDEMPEGMRGLLRRIDFNRDGCIDQAELAAFVNNPNTNMFGGLGVPAAGGGIFLVGSNPGTPAANIGLEYGDVLVSINGFPINTQQEYVDAVHSSPDVMRFVVRNVRTGQFQEMSVRLAR